MKKIFHRTSNNTFKLLICEATSDPTAEEMREYLVSQYGDYKDNDVDIEGAIYWFASLYHGGQWSNLYSALSTSEYGPGPMEKAPVPGGDVEYTYVLDSVQYETNELMQLNKTASIDNIPMPTSGNGGDDGNDEFDDDGDNEEYTFRIRKSDLEHEGDVIDTDDLERKMKEFLKNITKKNVVYFSYNLVDTRQIEESMLDMMFGSLEDKYGKQ